MSCCPFVIQNERKTTRTANEFWFHWDLSIEAIRFSTLCTVHHFKHRIFECEKREQTSKLQWILLIFNRNSYELFSAWESFLCFFRFVIWVYVYYWLYWNLHTFLAFHALKQWNDTRDGLLLVWSLKISHFPHSSFIGISSVNMWNSQF